MVTLAGRTALVTGSTSGIGAAIARAFAANGARVLVHGLDESDGRDLATEINGRFVAGDLIHPTAVDALAAALGDEEHLDILVNNAGFETHGPVSELDRAELLRVLEVNLIAPTQLVRLLLPRLTERHGGAILNVTSIHESVPARDNAAYAMAKAALGMFTRSAAIELAPRGVRVNSIAPGAIETPMNSHLLDQIGRDKFARWIPIGRVGQPGDVADAAVFLVSDQARYITGASLVVDGAYSHHLVRYDEGDQ